MKHFSEHFRTFSPFLKLLFLLMMVITGMIIFSVLGMLFALPFFGNEVFLIFSGSHDLSNPVHVAFLKYMQILSHLGMFIIPAFLYGKLFEGGAKQYFFLKRKIPFATILIGGFIMVLLLPIVNFLGALNSEMILPHFMKNLEEWMHQSETQAEKVITVFLSQTEWYALIANIFMIAVIPAVGEEMIFRGIVLQNFRKWTGNVHLAIFLSAFIFSAIHLQFYTFIPRLFLGIVLGYLFYWSGSLKLAMFAHFVNNGIAVIVAWLHAKKFTETDINTFGNLNHEPASMVLVSAMALAIIIFFWYINKKVNPYYRNIELH